MKFKTKILESGKTATGIKVPPEIVDGFGAGKKPPVVITINNYTYRSTVAVMGGVYMVGVSAEHRLGARVKGGDVVEVNMELDTKPREIEVPSDFQKILSKNSAARKYFESLSYSKKKSLIVPIRDAKTEETRKRRIEKAITDLKAGKIY